MTVVGLGWCRRSSAEGEDKGLPRVFALVVVVCLCDSVEGCFAGLVAHASTFCPSVSHAHSKIVDVLLG